MKKALLIILLSTVCAATFAENVRFKQFGTPIPARANLDVRWNTTTNAFPKKIWVYRLLPRKPSVQIISNLMTLCAFTDKDKTSTANPLEFKSSDGNRRLWISYATGAINYEAKVPFSPTNLVKGLPTKTEAINISKKILPQLGVSLIDIDRKENGSEPDFHVSDSEWMTFVKPITITNIEWRRVGFRRAVDGFPFLSVGTGGDGEIRFGEHGKILKIDLSWRDMEREKSYPTATSQMMIQSLREGKAVQGLLPMNLGEIDWRTVKSVTVNRAWPCYYAGDRFQPSDLLEPFAVLDTVVDTGHKNIRVEIDCPIIR